MFLLSVPAMDIQTDKVLVVKNKYFLVRTQMHSKFASVVYKLCDLRQAIYHTLPNFDVHTNPWGTRTSPSLSLPAGNLLANTYLIQLL